MPVIVTRTQWEARPPHSQRVLSRPVGAVYVHHTTDDIANITTFDEECRYLRRVQAFHMDSRGYNDIGYNFVVMPSGRIFEGRGWRWVGAHTEGENTTSLAWSFAGNYEVSTPSDEALQAVHEHIAYGISAGYISPEYGLAGHRSAPGASTTCPGRNLFARLVDIKDGIDMALSADDKAFISKVVRTAVIDTVAALGWGRKGPIPDSFADEVAAHNIRQVQRAEPAAGSSASGDAIKAAVKEALREGTG